MRYKIKKEKTMINITYEEIIQMIKVGFDLKFVTKNKDIVIDIFAGLTTNETDKKSTICYCINNEEKTIICDISFYRKDIEELEFYNYKTLKELLKSKEVSLVEIY